MPTKFKCDLSDAKDLTEEGLPEYVLTNAGCWPSENNDCAIVALAIAADVPYKIIHKLAEVCLGREKGKPTLNMDVGCELLPFKFRRLEKKRFRLSTLGERYPIGRHYVEIGGKSLMSTFGPVGCHALALVNGQIYDRHLNSPDRWVRGVWRIDGLKSDSWWGWKMLPMVK